MTVNVFAQEERPLTRRKHHEVVAEKKLWDERADDVFRQIVEIMNWPRWIDTQIMFMVRWEIPVEWPMAWLRRRTRSSMAKLGYTKCCTPSNPSGRWKVQGTMVVIYSRDNESPDVVTRGELENELERQCLPKKSRKARNLGR